MLIELPSSCKYELSDHFIQRWHERVPDVWDRFVWVLLSGAHHIMCDDGSRKTHALHFNPNTNLWYVFFYIYNTHTSKFILISVLSESYYVNVSNSAPIQYHKNDALKRLMKRGILPPNSGMVMHYRIAVSCTRRIIDVQIPWNVVNITDMYMFYVNFNAAVDAIILLPAFTQYVCNTYPYGVKIHASWLTIAGRDVVVDVGITDTQ